MSRKKESSIGREDGGIEIEDDKGDIAVVIEVIKLDRIKV
jgi:hypothetical protein